MPNEYTWSATAGARGLPARHGVPISQIDSALLRGIESHIRAYVEQHGGSTDGLTRWWMYTAGGGFFNGAAYYLGARGWSTSPTPCDTAPVWPTLVDAMAGWRNPTAAILRLCKAVLPP
jgi:hypothetical protein